MILMSYFYFSDTNVPTAEMRSLDLCKSKFVVGIIVKRMKQRPSILTEFKTPNVRNEDEAEEEEISQFSTYDSTCHPEDYLVIEAPGQIYTLKGHIDVDSMATGFVVGLYGYRDLDEKFFVKKVVRPELAPQLPCPMLDENT